MRAVIGRVPDRRSRTPAWRGDSRSLLERYGCLARRLGLTSQIARDGLWSFVLKVVSTTLSFLVAVVLARVLGAEGYGIYAYTLALVTLLALPAQAGLPNLVLRETARGMAQGRPDMVQGVWRWAAWATALLSVVLVVLAAIGLLLWRGGRMELREWTLAWALALVPLVALGNLRGAALRGLGRIVAGQLPEFLIRPGLFLVLVLGFSVAGEGHLSAPAVMALHVVAAAIAFAVGGWLLWQHMPPTVRQSRPQFGGRAWLASTIPLALIAAMQTVNNQADILILGLFRPDEQVGVYRVAVQAATLASFGLQAVNTVVAPRFARLYAKGDLERLQRLATASAQVVLGFNLAVTAFFIVFGKLVLRLVFGPDFLASYIPLLILLVGQFVNSAMGSVGFLLNMTGHERDTARGMAIAAIGNVTLNLFLVPRFGTTGAALATAITLIFWNILLWRSVRKRLGINSMAISFAVRRMI